MDSALEALFSWQFILFCIAVSAVTFIVRSTVDYILNNTGHSAKDNHLWTNLILPILPIVLGPLGAFFAKQYPYPMEITSASGRIAFGLCAGLLAGLVWRWVKAAVGNKIAAITKKEQ